MKIKQKIYVKFISNIQNNRFRNLLVVSVLVLFLIGGIAAYLSIKEKEDVQLRKIENLQSSFYNIGDVKKVDSLYKALSEPQCKSEEYIYELIYAYGLYLDPEKSVRILDSIRTLEEFEKLSKPIQFYTYYYLSNSYLMLPDLEKSFEYHEKASNLIEDENFVYLHQKKILKVQLRNIGMQVFDNSKESLESYLLEYNQVKHNMNSEKAFYFYYNISAVYNNVGQHEEAKPYAKLGIEKAMTKGDSYNLLSMYNNLATSYYGLQQYDSLNLVENTIREFFDNGTIDSLDFYQFKLYNIYRYQDKTPKDEMENLLSEIGNVIPFDCANLYTVIELYKNKASFHQRYNEPTLEREILLKELNFITQCTRTAKTDCEDCILRDSYCWSELARINKRLISIDLESNNKKDLNRWYTNLNVVAKNNENRLNLYTKVIKFLTQRDESFAQTDVRYQRIKTNQSKKISFLYKLITFLIIISLANIIYLLIKNKKHQKNLKEGIQSLKNQNRIIQFQNNKMQSLAHSLKDSNNNLKNFAKVAAHDIKSPISSLNSAVSYLSEKYKEKVDKEDVYNIHKLHEATADLTTMINSLLDQSNESKKQLNGKFVNKE